jgi:hypothetical protein
MSLAFGDVNVTEGNRERICGIGRFGSFCHTQQRTNHLLHLLLAGVSISGNCRFHLAWRIAESRKVRLCSGQENDASHLSEPQGHFDVQGCKHGFERNGLRLKLLDQVRDQPMNLAKMSISGR